MIATSGFTSGHVSFLVFFLFLLNSLVASSSTGSSSPDGRLPSSSPPPPLSSPPLTPSLSSQNINLEVIEASNENSVGNATAVTTTNGRTQTNSNSNGNNIPLWKQQLPFPLNNKTKTLQRILIPGDPKGGDASSTGSSDVEVFLLGTAHVSKDSSRDVRQLLESVEPDAIFLELCHQRLNLLEPSDNDDIDIDTDTHQQQQQQHHEANEEDVSNIKSNNTTGGFWNQCRGFFRRGQINSRRAKEKKKEKSSNEKRIDTKSFSSIASSLLSNMQGDYADSLGVELGGEFRAAYQYWKTVVPHGIGSYRKVNRIHNVHMILGDRPVTLTLTRAWESLRIWGKFKLMAGLLVSSLRKPNPDELREWMEKILYGDTDLMSESVTELAKHFPTLAEVILKERDAYMACKLHQTCRRLLIAGSRHNRGNRRYRLVAIVGAGHVEGICKWLTTGGSVSTISTVARTMASSSSSSSTSSLSKSSQQPPESPEDILSQLIQIKATIPQEDHDYLVHQITELDPELMNEISEIVEE